MLNNKEHSKSTIILIVISIIVLLSIIFYLILPYIRKNNKEMKTQTGCFINTFESNDDYIEISNLQPLNDEQGKILEPYTFNIRNNCTETSNYQIELEIMQDTSLELSNYKVTVDNEQPMLLSSFKLTENESYDAINTIIIDKGSLGAGATKNFNIRIWLDEDSKQDSTTRNVFHSRINIHDIKNKT